MIKINLSTNKSQLNISNIGGIDFSQMKIKAVIVAILLIFVPDFVLVPMWEEEITTTTQEVEQRQQKLAGYNEKVTKYHEFERQIQDLKIQEENLSKKLIAVKEAISEKRSPAPLLLYIAKNIPETLWITELDLQKDQMVIKGEALDYTSIGNFVNNLRASVFIKEANIKSTSSVVRDSDKRRIEVFEVAFHIARFDQ